MAWRVAKSLDVLLGEINASAPNRSKASDGSIGDEDHQNSTSDHNPWCQGWVVTARDFTHDPAGGFDSYTWADWQRKRCRGDILINGQRETRVKYIISNRQIASPTNNWAWRPYSGDSPHTGHAHISVDCTVEGGAMDSTAPWGWSSSAEVDTMWCKLGDRGTEAVKNLQQRLWFTFNTSLVLDGVYGSGTATTLKAACAEAGWNVSGENFLQGEVAALETAIARRVALRFGAGQPGPAGPPGPQGPKGDPGMPGDDGADAVLETGTQLTVTTLP